MFLKERGSPNLIRVLDAESLFNPHCEFVLGRAQAGEEEQELEAYAKLNLEFPSGEPLPHCWTDARYRGECTAMPPENPFTKRSK